jgi:ATP-binding cassette subfamily F protein uup
LAQVSGLRLALGGAPLFDDVGFVLHKGDRAALVGANGAGKSTLLRIIAGQAHADAGDIALAAGASIAFAPQEPDLAGFATLRDYVCAAQDGSGVFPHEADAALESLGLDPERSAVNLSGGETRRASLARAFARDADVLLLDEPTNHLDITAIEGLERKLLEHRGASLIVSHDRRFLERITNTTLWLRQRRLLKLERGFSAFDEWAGQVEEEEQRDLARLEQSLKAEEYWLRRGVTARRSRNEGRRRRLEALRAERLRRKELSVGAAVSLQAARGEASGKLVIEALGVSKSYGDRAIIRDLSLRILRGDRIGVVGPNGAGKTTLLEILLKRTAPDAGSVRHGERVTIAYVDQARSILRPEDTIWQALAPMGGDQVIVNGKPRHVAAYAGEFLFAPSQLRQPISALSGGERNRLALAVALARPANLLVLDEPTNDLDMDTLDALEEMLAAYDGAVILVSHDRAFLDSVATQIVGPLGGARWVESPGGWADFQREHGARQPAPSLRRKAPPAVNPAPRAPTKLSYKDERRAADLVSLIPELTSQIQELEAQLADPDGFSRDPEAFNAAAERLAALRADRDATEAEWLEIELRREALSGER